MAEKSGQNEKCRILIADDHSVVVEGIGTAVGREPEFDIVGAVQEGSEVLPAVRSLRPDIVILDISMPGMDGLEVAAQVREEHDKVRILIYSMYSSGEYITALFRTGVCGYVLKEEPLSELIVALKAIKEGGTFYSRSVRDVLQKHMLELELGKGKDVAEVKNGIAKLSTREKEVFVLLADGLRPREIAGRLNISPKTVETHKYNIMEKLDVSSVAMLTKIALKKDLIDL